MAKRRDELAAYTFARKRTVAAFLAPSPGGSEEGAPRPIRTVMPSFAVAIVLVIGFIAWGVIKPKAPVGWDTPGEYIIVDSDSTTRYVVLPDEVPGSSKKVNTLHPVLNYASAKLMLDKGKGKVIEVPGKEIDKSDIPHGATLGIPYAPDRLPKPEDAEKEKTWAVCERPAKSGTAIDRAVFVLDDEDAKSVAGRGKVGGSEVLYVNEPTTETDFLIDSKGNRLAIGGPKVKLTKDEKTTAAKLKATAIGSQNIPQQVSKEWLATLNEGQAITFPTVPSIGEPTKVKGLPADGSTVGRVLEADDDAQGKMYYVVLKNEVAAVTPFVAKLLLASPAAEVAYATNQIHAIPARTTSIIDANGGQAKPFYGDKGWPQEVPAQANGPETATAAAKDTSCSVYDGSIGADKKPNLTAWAGTTYPKKVIAESLNAYVSSGSGLLFTEVRGAAAAGGAQYLLTDTGLRYSLPKGNDNASDKTGTGSGSDSGSDSGSGGQPSETDKARTRLGYEKLTNQMYVPYTFAQFIPKGPTLDTGSAKQAQSQ
ncbi:type VII secretion protein EccB [Streptomyces sp. NBC_01304]|uniref:type VII secretion protein EccB n=1 Tax=Streptomyces sp. NBC_01304 TaxID=2903818 RepID=UPI002E15B38B|nr:type VII secretion protein EccB [Streptomyces sp. NBC_01304]